jgi:LuxR family maltose regulon positive regulatory protein
MPSLLKTKLHRPRPLPKRVERQHLVRRLNDGLAAGRRITLVSAPAGFGKTACASEWLEESDLPSAWLSLDEADDDPGRFFTYLIAALQAVDEDIGREIEGVLRGGQLPPPEIVSATLINDILEVEDSFVLVLDDFQVVQDTFILKVLETLLANQPPPLHLVVLTREDPSLPLAKLRANNQLTEIRAGDLRFDSQEAARFLNEVMGLSLSEADVEALEERTEGWVAGLQLVAIAALTSRTGQAERGRPTGRGPRTAPGIAPAAGIQDVAGSTDFIASLSGSHRFILNYLTEEVINRQTEDVQRFLLQTSVLEALNGDLCDAVTGRTDSRERLEGLFNANLFLIPLDDEGHWYRYHRLFADFLSDLEVTRHKEEMAGLHRRASEWYARRSAAGGAARGSDERSTYASQAIRHALAGGDYAAAVEMIESHAMDMLMQWHVKTVEGWMNAIPPEWAAQSPRANLAFAWMYLMRGNPERAAPYLARLPALFSDPQVGGQDAGLEAKWLALQAMLINAQGKPAQALELADRALEIASQIKTQRDAQAFGLIYIVQANSYQQLQDDERAMQAFQSIVMSGQVEGNSVIEMLGISGLALLAIEHGQYHFAFEIALRGIERIECSGALPPISTAVFGELGVVHYQWHQLEQAHRYFQRAIQVGALSGYSDAKLYYGVILSRLYQVQGDLEAAGREIQSAVDLMRVEAPATVGEEILSQQVRVALAQDRLAEAETALKGFGIYSQGKLSVHELDPGQKIDYPARLAYLSALRILLHRARARAEAAGLPKGIELAGRLIEEALERGHVPVALETLLLRAQMQAALGDEHASLTDLRRAVELGEGEGVISSFVEEGPSVATGLAKILEQGGLGAVQADYVQGLLAAFSESWVEGGALSDGKASSLRVRDQRRSLERGEALIEPLTDRELEVLSLMAEGLKYNEIAARLFISVNTVRSHVKAVYAKLNANNRTKAIELAKEAGIL